MYRLLSPVKTVPADRPLQHVAIIMDGNGRWARARGKPRSFGHRQGIRVIKKIVKTAVKLDIPHLSLFAFSSENWSRPEDEIRDLMGLLRLYLRSEAAAFQKNGIRIRVIGDRTRLPKDIQELIITVEKLPITHEHLHLQIALSYGGRQDLVAMTRAIATKIQEKQLAPSDITEETLGRHLSTYPLPDPDLLIRTSGEHRISNFMLWEMAYTELFFSDLLWPDFTPEAFRTIIADYFQRERRFGLV